MQDFKNKVAVITGAASGIGLGIAERCVLEGMHVVLADVEETTLRQVEKDLRAAGGTVLAVRTDVSRFADVQTLAKQTLDTFGAVHLLCNNAGVGSGGSAWESTQADWEWVIGVNLMGVIYGLRAFVPVMLDQDADSHIINTASVAGLLNYHPSAPYQVTKHAVVALSENVYFSLAHQKSQVKVSVLCPGWVNTRILEGERNRPPELQNPPVDYSLLDPALVQYMEQTMRDMRQAVETGMSRQQVAECVFNAIRNEQFYILTHLEFNPMIQQRMEDIVHQRNPKLG
jgi:NAD(P)-dependent dehydrogenase (short-subunit alcohol dehydrogenase family)